MNSKIIAIFFVPLVLSVGMTSVLPFNFIPEADALKSKGNSLPEVGSKKVCGDRLCSESPNENLYVSTETVVAELEKSMEEESQSGIETFETRLGTITLDKDYLTPESAQLLHDEMFFQRAVQIYQLALPAVSSAGVWDNFDEVGAQSGDVVYFSDFLTPVAEILTANISVLYIWGYMDLSDGPYVFEQPPGLYGTVDNLFQRPLTDFGITGLDKGHGGNYLFLPPNYDGEIPEGYLVVQSDTMQIFYIMRSFVLDGDKAKPLELIHQIKNYKLSEADNPPEQKFVDMAGKPIKMVHSDVDGFWKLMHKTFAKEPIPRPEDKLLIGLMQTIGLDPQKPFAPDTHSMELLNEAAVVGRLMAIENAYHTSFEDLIYPYEGYSNWIQVIRTTTADFEDSRGIPMIDARNAYFYVGITLGHAYIEPLVNVASKYLATYYDSENNFLDGSKLYHLHVPADVPVANFWSVIVYDADNRLMIDNGVQPQPGIRSLDIDKLKQNPDGSFDLYFGPEAPEGYESNWTKTNPDDGFWLAFRFYGPTQEYYDAQWKLPSVELVK